MRTLTFPTAFAALALPVMAFAQTAAPPVAPQTPPQPPQPVSCTQLETAIGLDEADCGTMTTDELVAAYLDRGDE